MNGERTINGSSSIKFLPLSILTAALLAGCGGGDGGGSQVPDEQQSRTPNVMDAGIVVGAAGTPAFTSFSAKGGVPPVPEGEEIVLRALIANDTFGQPIRNVWMTLPDVPAYQQPLTFAPSQDPEQFPYTYTTGPVRLPLAPGTA